MDLVIARELEIYGSHGMAARDYPAMLAQISSAPPSRARLVGSVIGLEQAGRRAGRDGWSGAQPMPTVIEL